MSCKFLVAAAGATALTVLAARPAAAAIVAFEAESGVTTFGLDTGFNIVTDANAFSGLAIDNVGTEVNAPDGFITYSVTFPEAGTYSLFARFRVTALGIPAGQSDAANDSFFAPNGFGAATGFTSVNNLNTVSAGDNTSYFISNVTANFNAPSYTVSGRRADADVSDRRPRGRAVPRTPSPSATPRRR